MVVVAVVAVVVVVVQTMLYDMCVSPYTPMSMHLVRVVGHLGVRLPATPPPLPRPNGGGQPWSCACAQGPYQQLRATFMPREAVKTRHWKSLDVHNRSIDHLVDEELGHYLQIGASTTLSTRNWGVSMVC